VSAKHKQPVLIVHGGAWAIPDDMIAGHLNGVRRALAAGWEILQQGGRAVDAIEAAVIVMEDDDTFDAGRGSFLTSDGRVQLDAMMMDGKTLRAGGVGCVERIQNPIVAARLVLDESPHVYLVAAGAERFAAEHGIKLIENSELVIDRERKRLAEAQSKVQAGIADSTFAPAAPAQAASHDTVGAVALDAEGNIAAATSTGGTLNKTPGRVGDSSLIGCGCYADNASAAVSCTGWGEPIMKLVLGKHACDRVASGEEPQSAAEQSLRYLKLRLDGHGGMILLDPRGRAGIAHTTKRMAWAWRSEAGERAGISWPE
jgi:beta-aspartyl-peptidase (threonine type)